MTRLKTFLTRFRKDDSGLSAIEFALIAPFMIILYLGMIELSFMISLDRKVTATASTLGDLTARETDIDNCMMTNIFNASAVLFQPKPSSQAALRVSSIQNNAGTLEVAWSEAKGPKKPDGTPVISPLTTAEIAALGIDIALIPDGETAIFSEASYQNDSLFGGSSSVDVDKRLSDTFLVRPRRSSVIVRDTASSC